MAIHEITQACYDEKLPLNKKLMEMLNEHFSHCTERRGCGFTQATRFLSSFINSPPNVLAANDLKIFSNWPLRRVEALAVQLKKAGWELGWRNLDQAPESILESMPANSLLTDIRELMPRLRRIQEKLSRPESDLFMTLLQGILSRAARTTPTLNGMTVKPEIGSCSQAEEYFLEIAHSRIRRGGKVNIIITEDGKPVLIEKIGLGESHSAIVIAPLQIFGVDIPIGGLCALQHTEVTSPVKSSSYGHIIPISDIAKARFLRLTTLAVPPEDRPRAFSQQLSAQLQSQMLSPATTTIEQLTGFALSALSESHQ